MVLGAIGRVVCEVAIVSETFLSFCQIRCSSTSDGAYVALYGNWSSATKVYKACPFVGNERSLTSEMQDSHHRPHVFRTHGRRNVMKWPFVSEIQAILYTKDNVVHHLITTKKDINIYAQVRGGVKSVINHETPCRSCP